METIVIFAAGKGTRMREITSSIPKSLIKIHGKPLLQYALEFAAKRKFDRVIINVHYLSDQIENFIKQFRKENPKFPEIILEYEQELLETGGTIKKLARLYDLGDRIFTLNSDIIIQAEGDIFQDMLDMWHKSHADILLLLQETNKAYGYTGIGDFYLYENGRIDRDKNPPYPYMFAGLTILNPQKIATTTDVIFSMKEYYPEIGKYSGTLDVRGIAMQGQWYHATNPEDVAEIEGSLATH